MVTRYQHSLTSHCVELGCSIEHAEQLARQCATAGRPWSVDSALNDVCAAIGGVAVVPVYDAADRVVLLYIDHLRLVSGGTLTYDPERGAFAWQQPFSPPAGAQ